MKFAGYADCPVLENGRTRVILGPHCGGRVLEYALNGTNALHLDPSQDGWTLAGNRSDGEPINPCGGRLDVGPEMVLPAHPALWLGPWQAETTGPRTARMSSVDDEATGLKLVRDFELPEDGSHLSVTQTMHNVSDAPRQCYHWSRTLARPGGVAVVPLTEPSRFPRKYIMYEPRGTMDFRPDDANIRVGDGFFVVTGVPKYPKLVLDSTAGWFAYLLPDNLLFVKRFRVWPRRVYGDISACTVCIYYHRDFVELEPIGPLEHIDPGASASFTEHWWLLEYDRPSGPVDAKALTDFVSANTESQKGDF